MQVQYLVFIGAIAMCGVLYLILKFTHDPIDDDIIDAQEYEVIKSRLNRALDK